MTATVRAALPGAQPLIKAMLDAYLRELAEHREVESGSTTADEYPYLAFYWTEPDRFPYTISSDGDVAGFALIRRLADESPPLMSVAEFYIAPAFRRRGIGEDAMGAIWRQFPGPWELQVHYLNDGARTFWRRCVETHAGDEYRCEVVNEEDGRRLQYCFDIP